MLRVNSSRGDLAASRNVVTQDGDSAREFQARATI
jgi:hypothetical protein